MTNKVKRTQAQVESAKARAAERAAKAEREAAERAERDAVMTAKAKRIAAQTLGGFAVDYNLCESDAERDNYLTLKARRYGTSTSALLVAITPYLSKAREVGKVDGRKQHLEHTQRVAFRACQFDNALLALNIDECDESRIYAFVRALQSSKRELVNALHTTKYAVSATQGYAYFLHSPVKNLVTDETLDNAEFYLVSTGWTSERSYPYYGVRMIPSDNPKKMRPIQNARPIPVELVDTDAGIEVVVDESAYNDTPCAAELESES